VGAGMREINNVPGWHYGREPVREVKVPQAKAKPTAVPGFTTISPNNYWKSLLTPWSRVLFDKLLIAQLVKILPAFYKTRRFITVYTNIHPCILSLGK
jgi:hypothetical protein